jgi:predicted nucleic acid-binding protein
MTTTTATEQGLPALDTPTVAAAAVTLVFAILAGIAIGNLPQNGGLGGALDALKNVIYMLTVPLFDLSRRYFAKRASRIASAPAAPQGLAPPGPPNVLRTAFASALVIFVLAELIGWLLGLAMGVTCNELGYQMASTAFSTCLAEGLDAFMNILIAPVMFMVAAAAGWLWRGLVTSRLWVALLIFMIATAGLFSLDFLIMLSHTTPATDAIRTDYAEFGLVRQVGITLAVLTTGVLVGYGARCLWQSLTGRLAA